MPRKLLIQILSIIMVIGLVGCSLFMRQAIPSSTTSAVLETIASPSSRLFIDRAAGIATLRG